MAKIIAQKWHAAKQIKNAQTPVDRQPDASALPHENS
jgi:hypothetical protein